ncbi:sensor histidine kinase [Antrihabitans sp. YC2-6]|uniref:sensor histidine kinase n=1 Tax=Antrihabitans sp. YC2-6 TaxID=2799498 RepID=UPI0018F385A4|nr:sensor histidine kinase [Antrihabitans sp. YC2-6]MBJ8345930.1 hypothetical protein [Antrihabitans sp. YC2-6]
MVALGPSVVEGAPAGTSKWTPAAWPLRWKVAAIMVLPVALAMTFGALRIQNELSAASNLTIASNNVALVGPAVALVDRTDNLAYAAASNRGIDDALAQFDVSAADFETLIKSGEFDASVAADLASASATAAALRTEVVGGRISEAGLAEKSAEVTNKVSSAIAATMGGVDDDRVQDLADGLVLALAAQGSLTTERVMVQSTDFADDIALRLEVAAALGAESASLDEVARQLDSSVVDVASLRAGIDSRTAGYRASGPGVVTSGTFVDSFNANAAQYSEVAQQLVTDLNDTVNAQAISLRSAALRDTAIILGSVLVALALALAVGRSLVRSISRLRHGALQVARLKLPEEIERLRTSEGVPEIEAIPVHTTEEIGQLARAVDDIHLQALRLAGEHGERLRIGDMFETLSRRSRSLVEEQLALIDTLERDEDDPVRLEHLFRLDHLTTRMRRNGDNLLVLADTTERRGRLDPIPLADVLRAGMSEVEDYRRVKIGSTVEGSLTGAAAADIGHLIAELIDNALRFSPPDSTVSVAVARAVDAGFLIEVIDRGLGMSEEELRAANERLASGGEVTAETARRMGLFVVGRLARRHEATVRLRSTDARTGKSGVTASVHVPGALIAAPREFDSETTETEAAPLRRSAAADFAPRQESRRIPVTPLNSALPAHGDLVGTGPVQNGTAQNGTAQNGTAQNGTAQNGTVQNGTHQNGTHSADLGGLRGLPRRSPGASGVSTEGRIQAPNGRPPAVAPERAEAVRPAPSNTSAFFSARTNPDVTAARESWPPPQFPVPREVPRQPAPEPADSQSTEPLPIFARLTSEWLMDPASASPDKPWTSAADAGWTAAEQAGEAKVERHTDKGLPVRTRGARLVPGGAEPNSPSNGTRRDPEAVRANLSRQLAGVRNGRARTEEGRHSREGDR